MIATMLNITIFIAIHYYIEGVSFGWCENNVQSKFDYYYCVP